MAEQRNDEPTASGGCPPWCVRRHTSQDHPEDRLHQSPPRHAVLVTGRPWLAHDARHPDDLGQASPVVARLVQQAGSRATWLEVTSEEDGAVRLAVTPESGRRLVAVLESLLEMVRV